MVSTALHVNLHILVVLDHAQRPQHTERPEDANPGVLLAQSQPRADKVDGGDDDNEEVEPVPRISEVTKRTAGTYIRV